MQSIADLSLFQLAEIGIEPGELVFLGHIRGEACILFELGRADGRADLAAEMLEPARVETGGLVIFIDQRFQLLERAIDLGLVSGGMR